MTIYQEYYARITARNDSSAELANPRQTFNWGYHDAQFDIDNKHARRTATGECHLPEYDPYYCAGYNMRWDEYTNMDKTCTGTSEAAWNTYVYTLPHVDYLMTVENLLESMTRGYEYLFSKKNPRANFTRERNNEIVKRLLSYAEPKNSQRRIHVYNQLCNRNLIKRSHDSNSVTQEYLDALYSSLKA